MSKPHQGLYFNRAGASTHARLICHRRGLLCKNFNLSYALPHWN